ncbi:MAG: hypothetical protein MUO31_06555 [Thermodesulfovibrionales bacterium]|nr:hypothetical protein [Thermodesulfovibrionales bacterium]
MKTSAVANDFHFTFHEPKAVRLFLGFVKEHQPRQVIINGDLCDFYKISKFDKDPNRIESLQIEIDAASDFLGELRDAATGADVIFDEGNHEHRLRKYLWRKAEALASLKCLELPKLLKLDKYHIKHVPYGEGVQVGKIFVYHGTIVRQDSSYTAKAEFLKNGCSGMSGHTHRDGKYVKRNRGGQFAWWENFCMCKLDPEYVDGIVNWSQGFSLIHSVGSKQYVEQIHINKGSYVYGGQIHK